MPNETWRPVPGWEGFYEVSDHGNVRSVTRTVEVGRKIARHTRLYWGRQLRLIPNVNGYLYVTLSAPHRNPVSARVHVLVAQAFLGPTPPGCEVLHTDGDKKHCALANLRYGTKRENALDGWKFRRARQQRSLAYA